MSPSLNCSDSPLPPGAWSQCLSWALSKRQRYVLERQYTYSPFPQPPVPLLGKPSLLRVSATTAALARFSLTLNLNLLVSNVGVVAMWIHRTEISLQLSHRYQPDGIVTSEVKGRTSKIITWNCPSPSFFSHPADTQYLILPSQLVIIKTQVSNSPMGAISDFFSIISGFGSMQVHSQCQHLLSDESFLSSVMHFVFRFDNSFYRDCSADCEVVRFSLPLLLLPYVQAFFLHFSLFIPQQMYWIGIVAHMFFVVVHLFAILPMRLFFVWTELVAFRAFFAISWPIKMKLLPGLSAE